MANEPTAEIQTLNARAQQSFERYLQGGTSFAELLGALVALEIAIQKS